jgi:hypothetical protein
MEACQKAIGAFVAFEGLTEYVEAFPRFWRRALLLSRKTVVWRCLWPCRDEVAIQRYANYMEDLQACKRELLMQCYDLALLGEFARLELDDSELPQAYVKASLALCDAWMDVASACMQHFTDVESVETERRLSEVVLCGAEFVLGCRFYQLRDVAEASRHTLERQKARLTHAYYHQALAHTQLCVPPGREQTNDETTPLSPFEP